MAKTFQVDTGGTLTTNLISYYKLEDVNDFYSTNNLTNTGSTTFSAGKVNNAANFGENNTTKSLSILSNLGINGSVSFSLWINILTDPPTSTNRIIDLLNTSTHVGFALWYQDTSGTKQLVFSRVKYGVAGQAVIATYTLTVGTWFHIVATYNGTNVELFVNKSSLGTQAASGSGNAGGTDHFGIGLEYMSTTNGKLSALVDEVGIWSKALSTTEITDLYNSGNGQTMTTSPVKLKTWNGVTKASIKTINGVAIASVKSINGVI